MSPDIAIIGMSGRFPGAANVREFWNVIKSGKECIDTLTDEELTAAGISRELLSDPRYVKRAAPLHEAEFFDAEFFNVPPSEARTTDPQQRLFLECAWEALESAGHGRAAGRDLVGVFGSSSFNTYLIYNLCRNRSATAETTPYQILIGNDSDHLCTRVSYKLDLKGPSVTVQSACSSSLVAIHMACQSLLNGECDLALAGGASVKFPRGEGYVHLDGGILSRDGQCRPLDHRASGIVKGDGVAVVVLRRLEDALEDHDDIVAVIKGSAVTNDGAARIGYTAPSAARQAELISEVLELAGVGPEEVDYHELHGTATAIGDVLEFQALQNVFGARTGPRSCVLGGLKANMGHLDVAAGVTGLIKAALCLHDDLLPPQINFERPNPRIDLENSPFRVNLALTPDAGLRHAGVSAFGLGGTSAYSILGAAPRSPDAGEGLPVNLIPVSARTEHGLRRACSELRSYATENPVALGNVAFTLGAGREHFEHRTFAVCHDNAELLGKLGEAVEGVGTRAVPDRVCAFLITSPDSDPGGFDGLFQLLPSFRTEQPGGGCASPRDLADWLRSLGIEPSSVVDLGASECGKSPAEAHLLSESIDDHAARLADAHIIFVIGPENDLACQIGKQLRESESARAPVWVRIEPVPGEPTRELASLLEALGAAWAAGLPVDFDKLYEGVPRRRDAFLPTYPFDRKRYCIDPDGQEARNVPAQEVPAAAPGAGPALRQGPSLADIEAQVIASWSKKLGVDAVDGDTGYSELGGESLDALEISAELQRIFKVSLPKTLMFTTPRVLAQQILTLLSEGAVPRIFESQHLVPIQPGSGSPPLVCVHPAGGTVFCYHGLARQLPREVPFFGIQAGEDQPGGVPSGASLKATARVYVDAMSPLVREGAFLLGGYSFGGNVALEMALQLRQSGIDVNELVLFDSHPPHAYSAVTSDEARFVEAFPRIVRILFGAGSTSEDLGPEYRRCRDVLSVIRLMHRDKLLPPFVDEATALRFYHTWRGNFQALRDHRPDGRFQGDVVMFRAREAESPYVLELLGIRSVPKEEWSDYVDGDIQIIDVPGDHYTMFSNRLHVKSVGDELARWLGSHPRFSAGPPHELCHA